MRLNKQKFEAWLTAKAPAEIVGDQRSCHTCPIAMFYHDVTGGHEIVIFDRYGDYFIDRGYSTNRAPRWAKSFIFAVDEETEPKITAQRAAEILASC